MSMQETSKRRWTTIIFFSVLSILFCGFIYFLVFMPKDMRYRGIQSQQHTGPGSATESRVAMDPERIVLPREQRIVFENLILIYKGIQDRSIYLDVIVTDLDPLFAYHHSIPISEAKNEFFLASQRFKLISSSQSLIRIRRFH